MRQSSSSNSVLGFYSFLCATPPQIKFQWAGKDWVTSAANINLGLTAEGSSQCVGTIIGQDIGLGCLVIGSWKTYTPSVTLDSTLF